MKNKILALVLALVLPVICLTGCSKNTFTGTQTTGSSQNGGNSVNDSQSSDSGDNASTLTGTHKAVMTVKDYGEIHITLDADTAPITVANFIKLAKDGFYNGLTFHRVASGFVIQGGDPEGNGTGGSDEEIKGEFAANGVENNLSHKRGVISMARNSISMDSASSQFFIVLDDAAIPSLDGQYAAFGWVTEGMEVVDKIAELPVTDYYSGLVDSSKQPVIESVKIVE